MGNQVGAWRMLCGADASAHLFVAYSNRFQRRAWVAHVALCAVSRVCCSNSRLEAGVRWWPL